MNLVASIRSSIRRKLLATMIGMIVFPVAILTSIQVSTQRQILEVALARRILLLREILFEKGRTLSTNLGRQAERDIATLNLSALVASIREQIGPGRELAYAILMDQQRRAYVHTQHPESEQDTVLSDEGALFASRQTEWQSREYEAGSKRFIEFVVPLHSGLQPWGWLRLGISLDALDREISKAREEIQRQDRLLLLRSVSIASGFVLLGVLMVLFISKRLSQPLVGLTETANELARGNFAVASGLRVVSNDEVGVLSGAFVRMAEELSQSYQRLAESNRTLESKVKERTGELELMTHAAQEARDVAEQATRAKSQFLAAMSHELRTPLNAIIGYTEMIQEESRDRGQTESLPDLQKVEEASKHLLLLINDILDLSKIEAGKMGVFAEDFDVARLVREVADTVQPLVARRANRFELACPDTLGTMRSDKTKVRQTLFNLLSNASKFCENGTISLRVRPATEGGRPWIELEVADTGIGITREQMGRLFEAFSQADASISGKYGGTGLGLALSRRFCVLLGGDLTVFSEPGKGAAFTMRLPFRFPAGPSAG